MKRKSTNSHYAVAVKARMNTTTSRNNRLHLLGLPAELRNQIYRYLLLPPGPGRVQIDGSRSHQPGLLRVCRMIHREGISIYYTDNAFTLVVQDFNVLPVQPFYELKRKYSNTDEGMTIYVSGQANWDNLLEWCKAIHGKGMVGAGDSIGDERLGLDAVMNTVFNMLEVEWVIVEKVLIGMRKLLAARDKRWAD
ncbi:hypothetical protein LTR37_001545 [Vermiconidia calcicola]|uniref:Uncharacterized protein n=1 Tax=Vermiconidia calcicola TaxID=1690605 RepID=A0ACC3NWY5_9PEZI|nr:hypothetical protein LTR37_001545 [Vermiconidia calcicola]